jgi:hypothetical protein
VAAVVAEAPAARGLLASSPARAAASRACSRPTSAAGSPMAASALLTSAVLGLP